MRIVEVYRKLLYCQDKKLSSHLKSICKLYSQTQPMSYRE